MVDIQSLTAENRRGKKEERRKNYTMWAHVQSDGSPQPTISGALCESSVIIPFLVPRRKVWLTPKPNFCLGLLYLYLDVGYI